MIIHGFDKDEMYDVINSRVFENEEDLFTIMKSPINILFIGCTFTGFSIHTIPQNVVFVNCLFTKLEIKVDRLYHIKFDRCTFENVDINYCHVSGCAIDHCAFGHITMSLSCVMVSDIDSSTFGDLIITDSVFGSNLKIYGCDFILDKSIVIMNSRIDSEITRCYTTNSRSSIYLYKCICVDKYNPGIHDNYYLEKIKTYESNLKDHVVHICPEEGSFICYKKLVDSYKERTPMSMEYGDDVIATLEIPADAKRLSTATRKCRAEYAKVLRLETFSGEQLKVAFSRHKFNFKYTVGEMIYPDSFDDNPLHECSNGIHFFMTKAEAIRY